ncbi:hypothetical protein ABKN59_006536 [Abortiporus biennis]
MILFSYTYLLLHDSSNFDMAFERTGNLGYCRCLRSGLDYCNLQRLMNEMNENIPETLLVTVRPGPPGYCLCRVVASQQEMLRTLLSMYFIRQAMVTQK